MNEIEWIEKQRIGNNKSIVQLNRQTNCTVRIFGELYNSCRQFLRVCVRVSVYQCTAAALSQRERAKVSKSGAESVTVPSTKYSLSIRRERMHRKRDGSRIKVDSLSAWALVMNESKKDSLGTTQPVWNTLHVGNIFLFPTTTLRNTSCCHVGSDCSRCC